MRYEARGNVPRIIAGDIERRALESSALHREASLRRMEYVTQITILPGYFLIYYVRVCVVFIMQTSPSRGLHPCSGVKIDKLLLNRGSGGET